MPDPTPQAAGTDMKSVPEVLAGDTVPPPPPYFDEGDTDPVCRPFSKQSMLCPDYARREAAHLWREVWQMACRERALPNVGDYLTYDILDQSVIIVRTGEDEFSAFHNVCQHRGLKLVEGSGSLGDDGQFKCSFHGWCYDGGGKLRTLPRAWDFPTVEPGKVRLPPVRIDRWDGWIFINFDPDAEPLADFLGDMLPGISRSGRRLSATSSATQCGSYGATGRRRSRPSSKSITCLPPIRAQASSPRTTPPNTTFSDLMAECTWSNSLRPRG